LLRTTGDELRKGAQSAPHEGAQFLRLCQPLRNIELKARGFVGDTIDKPAAALLGAVCESVASLDKAVIGFANLKREPDAKRLSMRLPRGGDDALPVERKLQRRVMRSCGPSR
jgi:hypothetical protein